MAVHSFTGVTGVITVNGTTTGFVSGDVTFSKATGKYVTLGSNEATAHTRGLIAVSGSLSKAWGISDDALMDLWSNDTEFDITFDNDGATGANTYTASNCVLVELSIEGLEAGSEGALLINSTFEGRGMTRD
jgi:hypothetical protein